MTTESELRTLIGFSERGPLHRPIDLSNMHDKNWPPHILEFARFIKKFNKKYYPKLNSRLAKMKFFYSFKKES